jgi:hypothetical protein
MPDDTNTPDLTTPYVYGDMDMYDTYDRHTMSDLQCRLLEEGKMSTEDAYTLSLVTTGIIPYDEYHEFLSDRRNHNSRVGRFAVQIAISGSITAFSMGMLIRGGDPGVYLPVLTGILGYWLPSPDSSKQTAGKKHTYSKPTRNPVYNNSTPNAKKPLKPAATKNMIQSVASAVRIN